MNASIQSRFSKNEVKNPELSSYINFERAIRGRNIARPSVTKWFGKLVDPDDYDRKDRKEILDRLMRVTSGIE